MKPIVQFKNGGTLAASLAAATLLASTPALFAGGPGGGGGGSGGGSGGGGSGGGGGAIVNVGSCTKITSFGLSQVYNPFYPADGFSANAVFIGVDLEGTSTCNSSGTGPLLVTLWFQNDSNNTISSATAVAWPLGVAMGATAGAFAPPGTPFTAFYSVQDSSGHVILSGSQNLATLPPL